MTDQSVPSPEDAGTSSATGRLLEQLKAIGWRHLDDMRWPGRDGASIDHVAIGPGGIFVIEDAPARSRASGATRCAEAAADIAANLPQDFASAVSPVLCCNASLAVTAWSEGVRVCSTVNLTSMLASQPQVLTPYQVLEASTLLNAMMSGSGRAVALAPPRERRSAWRRGGRDR
jgi:hypothetical protein